MARFAIRVHEVEHSGDRDAALAGIARAGAKVLEVVDCFNERGEDADDSIAVLVEFPGLRSELNVALVCAEVCI